jgi:hypothetical protein
MPAASTIAATIAIHAREAGFATGRPADVFALNGGATPSVVLGCIASPRSALPGGCDPVAVGPFEPTAETGWGPCEPTAGGAIDGLDVPGGAIDGFDVPGGGIDGFDASDGFDKLGGLVGLRDEIVPGTVDGNRCDDDGGCDR